VSTTAAPFAVQNAEELLKQPDEYQMLVKKIIVSHAINELAGAITYDEPAIAFAPTPYWKWLTCRTAWRWKSTGTTCASRKWAKRPAFRKTR
jgi:hypothetical protein